MELLVVVDDSTVGASPENITVAQLIESVERLPNSTEVTIVVTIQQNWKVAFEDGEGGNDAFDALLAACREQYPGCTGKIVSTPIPGRRALGSILNAEFTRPLNDSSAPITNIPQLAAEGVNVTQSTFLTTTAALSVTAPGGAEEANALSEGSLSSGEVASAVTARLGLNEDTLSVSEPQPIFPPMPPPSLPPSPPPSPPLSSPQSPRPPPSPALRCRISSA